MTIRGGLTRNRAFGADGRGGGGTFCDDSSIGFKIGFKTNAIERSTTFNKALDGFRFRRDKEKIREKILFEKRKFCAPIHRIGHRPLFRTIPKREKKDDDTFDVCSLSSVQG